MSERTIYRRFPTRSHLLEALARWIEAERFPLPEFSTTMEFRAAVHDRFRAYETAAGYAFVAARGGGALAHDRRAVDPDHQRILAIAPRDGADAETAATRCASPAAARYFALPDLLARMRAGFDMSADETFEAFDRGHAPDPPDDAGSELGCVVADSAPEPELSSTQAAILAAYSELIEEVWHRRRVVPHHRGARRRRGSGPFSGTTRQGSTCSWRPRRGSSRRSSPDKSRSHIFDVPIAIARRWRPTTGALSSRTSLAETAMRGVNGAEPAPHRERFDEMLREEVPSLAEGERRLIVAGALPPRLLGHVE